MGWSGAGHEQLPTLLLRCNRDESEVINFGFDAYNPGSISSTCPSGEIRRCLALRTSFFSLGAPGGGGTALPNIPETRACVSARSDEPSDKMQHVTVVASVLMNAWRLAWRALTHRDQCRQEVWTGSSSPP